MSSELFAQNVSIENMLFDLHHFIRRVKIMTNTKTYVSKYGKSRWREVAWGCVWLYSEYNVRISEHAYIIQFIQFIHLYCLHYRSTYRIDMSKQPWLTAPPSVPMAIQWSSPASAVGTSADSQHSQPMSTWYPTKFHFNQQTSSGCLPLWKMMEFVSWGDDIPNWMESHSKFHGSKPPTNVMVRKLAMHRYARFPAMFTWEHDDQPMDCRGTLLL